MDAALLLTTTADVAVGFGLLFFYSSVAAAVETAVADLTLVLATIVVADVVITTTVANGLSFFLFSSAVAEITVPAANFFSGVVLSAPSYIL